MFIDNVVLKIFVYGVGCCEEIEKDRCFLFFRKLIKEIVCRYTVWDRVCYI